MAYVRGVVCTVKVAVYLSGLPKKSKNEFKKMILNAWCTGVQQCGDQVVQVEDNRIVNCDLAVIQGYVHEHGKQAPHLQIRRNAIVHQKTQGKHALIIDSNLYQFAKAVSDRQFEDRTEQVMSNYIVNSVGHVWIILRDIDNDGNMDLVEGEPTIDDNGPINRKSSWWRWTGSSFVKVQ